MILGTKPLNILGSCFGSYYRVRTVHCSWFHYDRILADVIDYSRIRFANLCFQAAVCHSVGTSRASGLLHFLLSVIFFLLTFKEQNEWILMTQLMKHRPSKCQSRSSNPLSLLLSVNVCIHTCMLWGVEGKGRMVSILWSGVHSIGRVPLKGNTIKLFVCTI